MRTFIAMEMERGLLTSNVVRLCDAENLNQVMDAVVGFAAKENNGEFQITVSCNGNNLTAEVGSWKIVELAA